MQSSRRSGSTGDPNRAAWQLHWGIFAIMNIRFRYQLSGAAYASFLDVERLIRRP